MGFTAILGAIAPNLAELGRSIIVVRSRQRDRHLETRALGDVGNALATPVCDATVAQAFDILLWRLETHGFLPGIRSGEPALRRSRADQQVASARGVEHNTRYVMGQWNPKSYRP